MALSPFMALGLDKKELNEDEEAQASTAMAQAQQVQQDDEQSARIKRNIDKIIAGGGKPNDIQRYLRDVERLEIDYLNTGQNLESPEVQPFIHPQAAAGGALIRGAIKGVAGLGSVAGLAADSLRFIVDAGKSALGQEDGLFGSDLSEGAKFHPTLFNMVNQGGREAAKFFDPRFSFEKGDHGGTPTFGERAAEKVGEYVLPGGILTRAMTQAGARLIARNPESVNILQKLFIEAAKNPGKTQMVEAGFNAGAAIAGETAVSIAAQSGNPEDIENAHWIRFGAELASLGLGAVGFRLFKRLDDFTKTRFMFSEEHRDKAAKLIVGQWFDEVAMADPKLLRLLGEAEETQKRLGMTFLTPQVLANPNVQAAFQAVVATNPLAATRYINVLEATRKRVIDYQNKIASTFGSVKDARGLQTRLLQHTDRELGKIDRMIESTIKKAEAEAEALRPGRPPRENGEAAYEYFRVLEEEATAKVDALYNRLDNAAKYPVNHIKRSILEAAQSKTVREVNKTRAKEKLPLLSGLKGNNFGDLDKDLIESMILNFGKDVKTVNVLTLREWRKMIGWHLRHAHRQGNMDSVDRLLRLRDGVDKQFRMIARRETGKARSVLDEANEFNEQVSRRFDSGYAAAMSNQSISGRSVLAPEDFGRNWIRTNKQKDSIRAAEDYRNAFGENDISRNLIRDAVAWELNQFKTDGRLDINRISKWLKDREQNLRAHGVWDDFDSVGKVEMRARDAEKFGYVKKKEIENSIVMSLTGVNDLKGYIRRQIKAGRLGEVAGAIRRGVGKNPRKDVVANRGWNRNVFDAILSDAQSSKLDTTEELIRKPDTLLVNLLEHKDDLIAGVGKEHYNNLVDLARIWRLQEGRVDTFGAVAPPIAITRRLGSEVVQGVLSKIRASLQGFVSPHFTAGQLAVQFMNILNQGAAQRVVEEAMFNPRFAKELIDIARQEKGKAAVRMIGTVAAQSTVSLIEEDDERVSF